MGSQFHTQGLPKRASLISSKSFLGVMARLREQEADIRRIIYDRPLGRRLALARGPCNSQPFVVANDSGRTFSPNSVVIAASNTGHEGEVIIAGPPPGNAGASLVGSVTVVRTKPAPPPEEIAPVDPTLYPIIGFVETADTITANVYEADGTYRRTLSSMPRPAGWAIGFVGHEDFTTLDEGPNGPTVVFWNSDGGTVYLYVWELLVGNLFQAALPASDGGDPDDLYGMPFIYGSEVRLLIGFTTKIALYGAPLDFSTPPAKLSEKIGIGGSGLSGFQDGSVIHAFGPYSFPNGEYWHFPLDGSTPTSDSLDPTTHVTNPDSVSLGIVGARLVSAGTTSTWVRQSELSGYQGLISTTYDSTTKIWDLHKRSSALALFGVADNRAISVSRTSGVAGVYPFGAAVGAGHVMKINQANALNTVADPRVTLQAHLGLYPKFAYLYDYSA